MSSGWELAARRTNHTIREVRAQCYPRPLGAGHRLGQSPTAKDSNQPCYARGLSKIQKDGAGELSGF